MDDNYSSKNPFGEHMNYSKLLVATVAVLAFTGCASIVSKSSYPVAIKSVPPSVKFTVYDKNGALVHEGTTPETVTLSSKGGYFQSNTYKIEYSVDGGASKTIFLTSSIDGWYWGNFAFGGFIGFLFVDPATGAMFKLPEEIVTDLRADKAQYDNALKLATTDSLPDSVVEQLVRID